MSQGKKKMSLFDILGKLEEESEESESDSDFDYDIRPLLED